MVNRRSALFLVASLASACGNNQSTMDGGTADMAVASTPDLATSAPDLAMSGDAAMSCGMAEIFGPQYPNVTPECTSCVQSTCCAERATCSANAECVAIRDCYTKCSASDATCQNDCVVAHPNGKDDNNAFSRCRNSKCGAPCANYACAGTVTWSDPGMATQPVMLTVFDYQMGSPIAGAMLRACPLADTSCASPIASGMTDMNGAIMMTLPTAKSGAGAYIETTAKGYVQTISFIYLANGAAGLAQPIGLTLVSTQTWNLLTGLVDITPDPNRGELIFSARDCTGYGGAGLSVGVSTADANTSTIYIAGLLPSKTATQTDSSGAGGVLDIPPGPATLTTKIAASGKTYSTEPFFVRAGWNSALAIIATP